MSEDRTGEDKARFVRDVRRTMEVCPGCKTPIGAATCHMYYSTWDCWGCGAKIDGRVATPELVLRCENEWPEYERHFGDPIHPIACSCTGHGWYPLGHADGWTSDPTLTRPEKGGKVG